METFCFFFGDLDCKVLLDSDYGDFLNLVINELLIFFLVFRFEIM